MRIISYNSGKDATKEEEMFYENMGKIRDNNGKNPNIFGKTCDKFRSKIPKKSGQDAKQDA
jgi:hypothetical protein